MKKQTLNAITLIVLIILSIPYKRLAECCENSTSTEQSINDFSQLDSDTL